MVWEVRNRYFLLRHGQSEANAENIIISDPESGVFRYGLTEVGRSQAREAGDLLRHKWGVSQDALVISSDFRRAFETAHAVAIQTRPHPLSLSIDTRLRERYFGRLEGGSASRYTEVWDQDAVSETHCDLEVETCDCVAERTRQLIVELESEHDKRDIILVAHGDTLQILQAVFAGLHPRKHRSLPHLATAEIRVIC